MTIFGRPGRSQRLLLKQRCHNVNDYLIHPLLPMTLQRRQALTVRDGAFSHKIDFVAEA